MLQTLSRIFLFLSVATISESFAALNVGIPISVNKVFTFLLLVTAGLQLLSRQVSLVPTPKNIWLIAFAFGVIPGLGTSYMLGSPITTVLASSLTLISVILFYALLNILIREPRDVSIAVWAVVIGTAVTALTTIAGVGQDTSYYGRGGGIGGNPNLSALYAVTGIGMSTYVLLTEKAIWRRLLMLGFIGLNMLAIVQTVSRAGLLSLLAMAGFILVRYRRLDLLQFAIPAGVLAALAFFVFAPESYYLRIASIGEEASDLAGFSLANDRIRSWYYGFMAFLNYPLSGCGIRTFHDWLAIAYPDAPHTPIPHSSYIRLLATTGLFGFIPWMAAAVVTWVEFSKVRAMTLKRRSDDALRTLFNQCTFFQAIFFAWLVAGLVSPFEWEKGIWLCFGLSTALLAVSRRMIAQLDGGASETSDTPSEQRGPIESPYSPRPLQAR